MADDIEGNILMEIAIVDDEKIICNEIKKWIKKIKPCCHADEYARGEDMLFADKLYNIVFLDIQLKGRDGIDIAEELRQKSENTIVIFITGVKDYVFQAFDVAAFHYLLKPIDAEKFEEVFARAWKEAEKERDGVFVDQNQEPYISFAQGQHSLRGEQGEESGDTYGQGNDLHVCLSERPSGGVGGGVLPLTQGISCQYGVCFGILSRQYSSGKRGEHLSGKRKISGICESIYALSERWWSHTWLSG